MVLAVEGIDSEVFRSGLKVLTGRFRQALFGLLTLQYKYEMNLGNQHRTPS